VITVACFVLSCTAAASNRSERRALKGRNLTKL